MVETTTLESRGQAFDLCCRGIGLSNRCTTEDDPRGRHGNCNCRILFVDTLARPGGCCRWVLWRGAVGQEKVKLSRKGRDYYWNGESFS